MASPSAGFIAKCRAQTATPRIRFSHDGTRYDSSVLEVSDIHRDSSLASGQAVVTVENTDGDWNFLLATNVGMGASASISLKFSDDNEVERMFTGTVERVEYVGKGGSKCLIHIRDKMAKMLNQRIGDGSTAEGGVGDYWSGLSSGVPDWDTNPPFRPADLAWGLLVDRGGLDNTKSSANPDIEYANWVSWKGAKNPGWNMNAWFTGQTIREALLRIAQMTDSYIWVNGSGKIDFAPGVFTGETYTTSNSRFISLEGETPNMINDTTINHGYNLDTGEWGSPVVTGTTGASQAQYGTFPYSDRNTVIWNYNQQSAELTNDGIHLSYAYPVRLLQIEAPLQGFLDDIARRITYTNSNLGITAETAQIEDIVYSMKNWTVRESARWDW